MSITSISVVMTVVVLNFHYCGPTKTEVPEILRNFLRNRCNFPFKDLHKESEKPLSQHSISSNYPENYHSGFRVGESHIGYESDMISNKGGLNLESVQANLKQNQGECSSTESISNNMPKSDVINMNYTRNPSSRNIIQKQILSTLEHLNVKQLEEERNSRIVHEWRLIAQMIDSILFWFFFVGTLTLSVTLLVIMPMCSRREYT